MEKGKKLHNPHYFLSQKILWKDYIHYTTYITDITYTQSLLMCIKMSNDLKQK